MSLITAEAEFVGPGASFSLRTRELFADQCLRLHTQTDRMFAALMLVQWVAGIIVALVVSPQAWAGTASSVHPHLQAAVVLGALIASLPVWMAWRHPGHAATRHCIAVGQMLFSALFIHLSGGRIETHFHVFGSLAFLSFYRDWRVLVSASVVVAVDHLVRGLFWPQSVYGILSADSWRTVEHAAWVVFEDMFLLLAIRRSLGEMRRSAQRQAQLESLNATIEQAVAERTKQLKEAVDGLKREAAERQKVEAQLLQAQKMEAVGQLAGGIAHDFNNILGAIIGNTEVARLTSQVSPAVADCLDSIMKASRRARDLVKQILAFSRRQEQQRLPMQLQTVVREALKLLRSTVPATIEFKPNLLHTPAVLADASQIHQVVVNLCTNAVHALRDQPGVIKVELAELEADPDFAKTHADLRPGRYVRLTVADNGCGMDRSTLEHIFEPFFTTKAPGEGTGLGLSVVHGIVKSHEGGVTVYSEPGKGTTFNLYFPVFDAEPADFSTEAEPVPRGGGQHILFVDDEEPLATLGKVLLERLGYRVTSLTSVKEALAVVRDQPQQFDLVVTDLTMPDMNGVELARQLLTAQPHLPIILTTGFGATLTPESAREMGFRELLFKPNTFRTLGGAVHRVLADGKPA